MNINHIDIHFTVFKDFPKRKNIRLRYVQNLMKCPKKKRQKYKNILQKIFQPIALAVGKRKQIKWLHTAI